MSAGTNLSASAHPRALRLGDLLIAGWAAPVAVTLAGLTLGFFGWYAFFVPGLRGAAGEIGLIGAMLAGMAFAIAAWLGYSRYLSHRATITLARSLRYDGLTWPPFLLLWLTFVSSSPLTHGARLFVIAGALFCIGKVLIAARFNQTVREVLIDFAATRIAIVVIAELAAVIIGQRAGTHVQESSHVLLAVWGRWDAVHYLDIATQGYQGTDMAFFPLYPLLIRLVGALAGNHLIAGLLISSASFFLGLLYLYKLLEHEYDRAVARRAIFYVSIFPTAVYFTAVYTESLFFMLTVASFYYMREHRWWIAGLSDFWRRLPGSRESCCSSLPDGVVGRAKVRQNVGSLGIFAAALIPLGLGVYMAYLWVLRADPLYFSHVQIHWNRHLAPPWVSMINAFEKLVHAGGAQAAHESLEVAFTLLMIGS